MAQSLGRTDRDLPIYIRIADAIHQEIVSGALQPNMKLPSEHALMEKYGVARETVRRALARLQTSGFIYAKRAVGNFVSEPLVDQELDQLFSFSEVMAHRGMKAGTRLLAAEVHELSTVDSPVLAALHLPIGERVIYLRRLRLGNKQPLVIATTFLPARLFPGFLEQDLKRKHVYDIMEQVYGRRPDDATQTFEAVTLGSEDAKQLGVAPGSPALLITRIGYSRGTPVEYATDYYRGDRTRFRVRLGHID
ncbi:MAG: GntR family transcriptional regulator [Vicinamibacteraceae bacterium]